MVRIEELFPRDLQARLEQRPLLVLPFGTLEWHSHHLPLGLDGMVAEAVCEAVAENLAAVLAPISYWAVGGVPYPYTLNLSGEVIEPLYRAVFEQFAAMGFRVIAAFTGHFGLEQTITLKRAALAVMRRSAVTILPVTDYDLVTDLYTGDHAGTGETSLLWHIRPELVRLEAVPGDEALDGVQGEDPRGKASAEWGQELLETIARRTAETALRLLDRTSPVERMDYLEALWAGILVLEKILQQRKVLPRKDVASIQTPAYREYCQEILAGDYRAAKRAVEKKLVDLTL